MIQLKENTQDPDVPNASPEPPSDRATESNTKVLEAPVILVQQDSTIPFESWKQWANRSLSQLEFTHSSSRGSLIEADVSALQNAAHREVTSDSQSSQMTPANCSPDLVPSLKLNDQEEPELKCSSLHPNPLHSQQDVRCLSVHDLKGLQLAPFKCKPIFTPSTNILGI